MKKKRKKRGLLDGHDPKWFQGFPRYSLVLTSFLYLVSYLFPLSLPVHFVGVLAQFPSKGRGGGGVGGGDRGVPRVGLFNLYRVHFKRYQESWGVPLVATHHPLGSYSASVH